MPQPPPSGASSDAPAPRAGLSRRQFLGTAGVGAVALSPVAATAGPVAAGALPAHPTFWLAERFTRMFPHLPPFATDLPAGAAPGTVRAGQARRPARRQRPARGRAQVHLIVDPSLSAEQPQQPHPHGGDDVLRPVHRPRHDLRRDSAAGPADRPRRAQLPHAVARPRLGLRRRPRGPAGALRPVRPVKLRVGTAASSRISPATRDGTAIIGDPRNDENLIIAGLHCAFPLPQRRGRPSGGWPPRRDRTCSTGAPPDHLALPVAGLHEFLPQIVGQAIVDDVLRTAAASTRRPRRGVHAGRVSDLPATGSGTAWSGPPTGPTWPATTASRSSASSSTPRRRPARPRDLRGGARAPPVHRLADLLRLRRRPGQAQQADRHQISTPLFNLPLGAIASPTTCPTSLPQRNLLRHLTWAALRPGGRRPSGVPRSRRPTCKTSAPRSGSSQHAAVVYVLQGGRVDRGRPQLGPVGGRIVAEVLIGLLQADPGSYLPPIRRWTARPCPRRTAPASSVWPTCSPWRASTQPAGGSRGGRRASAGPQGPAGDRVGVLVGRSRANDRPAPPNLNPPAPIRWSLPSAGSELERGPVPPTPAPAPTIPPARCS